MYELYPLISNPSSLETKELLFTVTLVDDDALYLAQMKDYLQSMKINKIECFNSGEEFLAVVKESDKRLVVCDLDFGSSGLMSGFDILDEIRKRKLNIPVIMLSGQDKLAIAVQTLMKGAVDYFFKGMENTFTSVFTSILKINELQRLKKNEKDYITTLVIGSIISVIVIGLLIYNLYK